jgi:hypothetical protein
MDMVSRNELIKRRHCTGFQWLALAPLTRFVPRVELVPRRTWTSIPKVNTVMGVGMNGCFRLRNGLRCCPLEGKNANPEETVIMVARGCVSNFEGINTHLLASQVDQ